MAPPSPRRPGFSRRAQYGIFATYVIALFGAILSLLLVVTARLDPTGHAALQSLMADITSPLSSAGRSVMASFGDFGASVSAYFDAASKNKAMEAELRVARRTLVQAQVDAVENRRLKGLLGIRETEKTQVIAARLVASTASSSRRYATLAAGRSQGVSEGQSVQTVDGLVGRIVQVGQISSRILLIIDGKHVLPVKRASDGLPALAVGTGDGLLEIRPLAASANPFKQGDVFVTSGTGGIYRPNVPVARAMRTVRTGTTAVPLADPAGFDFALVLPAFIPDLPMPVEAVPAGTP
jgi:rod shape-determining protein MreC